MSQLEHVGKMIHDRKRVELPNALLDLIKVMKLNGQSEAEMFAVLEAALRNLVDNGADER